MKLNQKGFGIVEVLVIILALGILVTLGWLVYDRQKTKANTTTPNTSQAEQKNNEAKNAPTTSKIDTSIHDVDIRMQNIDDIDKLPDYTPASFKAYMTNVLQKNNSYHSNIDDVDVITEYRIDKISQVNISGGTVPVSKDGAVHSGGAPAIWVLTPAKTWDQETLNGPLCKSTNGGAIYREFAEECYTGSDLSSWTKNPNGSIESQER